MSLNCWRKLERPEETHANTKICKPQTKKACLNLFYCEVTLLTYFIINTNISVWHAFHAVK